MKRQLPIRNAKRVALLVLLMLVAAAPAVGAAAAADARSGGSPTPVDLNSAPVDVLTGIPGIGEVMAQRIVDWREEHGPFRRVEDLMKVKGVGEKTFDKLRPYVKVGKSR
jgi:competence protein ComEA